MMEKSNTEKTKSFDMEELFNGEWERKNRSFQYFINYKLFKGKTIFGYVPYRVIFEFPSFVYHRASEFLDELKWAYQRVVRGWDDRASWSLDYWMTENVLEILKVLKKNKHGIPSPMFDGLPYEDEETYSYSDESYKIAEERWNVEIDKMIAGFEAAKKMQEWENINKYKQLEKTFQEGMASFVKYYFNLWD